MNPPPTHLLYPAAAQHYFCSYPPPPSAAPAPALQNYVYSHPAPSASAPAVQNYVYTQPPPSAADPAQNYLYSHPPPSAAHPSQHYTVYSHPQPPAAPSVLCTPMSPYRSQNPPQFSLPHPPNSSVDVGFRPNAQYPLPQSHAINNNNNDDYLRRIRNEVIFLHALWDQGPPASVPNSSFTTNHHLKPSPTTVFKKTKKPTPSVPVPDNPWPVPPESSAPPDSESGWPELPSRLTPPAHISSEEDIVRVSPAKVQRKALDSFQMFFRGKHGPESESESDDDVVEDQDDVCATFDTFWEVFQGDPELRDYYVKNWGSGEFLCLVCGGSGQKVGRKYKNSLALVQHTITVSNTKKRKAHRAYGQVICKVLGWDINQLPLVSRNLCLQQGNGMSSAEACKDDPVAVETSTAPLVSGNEQLDPSEVTSNLEENISAEKKETSDLAMILDNFGDQQGNAMSSAEACKDDPVVVETSIAPLVSGNEQSDPSKATSDLGESISAEKKETSDLSLMLDNPAGQQINTLNSADTSKNHPDISEEKTDATLNEHVLSAPLSAVSDTADDNAENNETSILSCTVMGSQGGSADTYTSVHEPATQI